MAGITVYLHHQLIFLMLRIFLLCFCLLGLVAPAAQAASTEAATRPIHRHKPMAGNYRPVYKLYRGHSRRHNRFMGLFQHRSTARRGGTHAPKVRGHRGTL